MVVWRTFMSNMSIEPRAELPSDIKENYHFGEM